jgi:hypothetical protein
MGFRGVTGGRVSSRQWSSVEGPGSGAGPDLKRVIWKHKP